MRKTLNVIILILIFYNYIVSPLEADDINLSNHPIYSKYKFSSDENVINIGTQPLYMPTGHILEAIKRDKILYDELSLLSVKVEFYSFLKGHDVNFFLANGSLDGGVGGDMPALLATTNSDIVITNLIQMGFTSIVANEFLLIDDLRGKRVGYPVGSNAHYSLLLALSTEKLTIEDIKAIPLDVNEMQQSLKDNTIDLFSAWQPTVYNTIESNSDAIIIHKNLNTGYLYFNKKFSTDKRKAMHYIVAATIRAINWLRVNHMNINKASEWNNKAIKKITGESYFLSDNAISKIVSNDIIGLTNSYYIPKRDLNKGGLMHKEFEFLKDINKISGKSEWNKVIESFDSSLIDHIISHKKKYKIFEYNYSYNR